MKAGKIISTILLAIVVAAVGFVAGFFINVTLSKPESDTLALGDLSIHFIELGNKYTGDSIYIKAGETDILIDAGSRYDSATAITQYVDQYVTDGKLEYVIATHADQDHISAFVSTASREGVLEHYDVGTIIDFPRTNKTGGDASVIGRYRAARDAAVERGAVHYTALQCFEKTDGASNAFQLADNIEMEILYNKYYTSYSSDENNYSVCMMINQGDNHFLFTGDLEEDGEKALVEYYGDSLPECVLYKAGHHGSATSSTPELMAAIKPQYVVVCCCCGSSEYTDNNLTQFPTQDFINNVAPYTENIYVTSMAVASVPKDEWSSNGQVKSMNGNIVISVSRSVVSVQCSGDNRVLKDTEWFAQNRTWPSNGK